jgi:serine/threonine protein kinase
LGKGAFGVVLRGKLVRERGDPFNPEEYQTVGVKTLPPGADLIHFKALLSELNIFSKIGRHDNIVNLLGACTSELKHGKVYVLVEFCPLGSVYNYLRANRGIFDQSFETRQAI